MEYTEQQKKEYQEMRRTRFNAQQELRTYLKGGFEMSAEDNNDLLSGGYTKGGAVLQQNRTGLKHPRLPLQKQNYRVVFNKD